MESFHLFFSLNLGHRIFSHTGNLYRTLQANISKEVNRKRIYERSHQLKKEKITNLFYYPSR